MMPLRAAALLLAAGLAPAAPAAGPSDAMTGSLFGYRIASAYPLTDRTEIVSRSAPPSRLITLVAEQPVKPEDIREVLLIVTPVSHTITTIGVKTPFADEETARVFAVKYLRLFSAKYPDAEADLEVIGRRGRIRFGRDYELVMTLLSGNHDDQRGRWIVEFLYQARPDSPVARSLSDLLADEIDEATLEGQDTRGL